jgi:hypothetical protein
VQYIRNHGGQSAEDDIRDREERMSRHREDGVWL